MDTNALVAVGASASVIQMLVGFFMGLSVGAGVVIAQYFGAGQKEKMSQAVHSALALTVLLSALFTVAGIVLTRPLLRAIGVPQEVLPHSTLYLTIYFAGITFLLFYNMGSGILRAIGNSRDPLIYLAVASVLKCDPGLLLVCVVRLGVAGVALGNHDAQAVSAYLVMRQLIRTREAYRVELKKIRFHREMIRQILMVGLLRAAAEHYGFFQTLWCSPISTALERRPLQATLLRSGSMVFTACTAEFFTMTITTFVGQNIGARKTERVKQGIFIAWVMCSAIILAGSVWMNREGALLVSLFTDDAAVMVPMAL